MKKHGGKRNGAGRKPSADKKQTVVLYIKTSIINQLGGIDNAKQKLYNFAKIDAGGEIIKTVDNAAQPIKSEDKCNMHFVSNNEVSVVKCHECLGVCGQDELDMFNGMCEECSGAFDD